MGFQDKLQKAIAGGQENADKGIQILSDKITELIDKSNMIVDNENEMIDLLTKLCKKNNIKVKEE